MTVAVPAELRDHAVAAKGFMPPDEGDALFAAAVDAGLVCPGLPFLEVGSYCGRSTIWLGGAARESGTVVFAVDHHRGSEENQAGWDHHDPTVVDERIGRMDTLPLFRAAVYDAGVEDFVVAVVGAVAEGRSFVGWATGVPVHRRRARGRAGSRRLRGLDPARRGRGHARDPRRLPGSGRRWPPALRADLPPGDRQWPLRADVGHGLAAHPALRGLTRDIRLTSAGCHGRRVMGLT